MKEYKNSKMSLSYRILFILVVILTMLIALVIFITGDIPYSGLGGYFVVLSVFLNQRKYASIFVVIDNNQFIITNGNQQESNLNTFSLSSIEKISFRKNKWYSIGAYRIEIKQHDSLVVYSQDVGGMQLDQIKRLAKDLRNMQFNIDISNIR